MTSSRDDDALGWAGDDDPTLVSGTNTPGAPDAGQAGDTGPSGDIGQAGDTGADLPEGWAVTGASMSSPALLGLGILGGVYLLYTIGWVIGVGRLDTPLTDPLAQFMFSLGTWLAIAAPAVWFGTSFWLTRTRPRLRWTFLILGALLLAPLPFIAGTGTL